MYRTPKSVVPETPYSKDLMVAQLRTEISAFKDLETDFIHLNDEIAQIESKYSLLLDEKDRIEKDSKLKLEAYRKTLVDLRVKSDELKIKLNQALQASELVAHQNEVLRKEADQQNQQILDQKSYNAHLEEQSGQTADDGRFLLATIASIKQDRNRLEKECDELSAMLDKDIEKLKILERECRNIESAISIGKNNLEKAEKEQTCWRVELGSVQKTLEQARHTHEMAQAKGDELSATIARVQEEELVALRNKTEVNQKLQTQILGNKEALAKLKNTEQAQRNTQQDILKEMRISDNLNKKREDSLLKNKRLSQQVDRYMSEILELEKVNSKLLNELTRSNQIDEQVLAIMARKSRVSNVLAEVVSNIEIAHRPISEYE